MSLFSIYGTKALSRTCNLTVTHRTERGTRLPCRPHSKGRRTGQEAGRQQHVSRTHYPSARLWRVRREVGMCVCMYALLCVHAWQP